MTTPPICRTHPAASPHHVYRGFGLVIVSDLAFPELPPADLATPAPTVAIRLGAVPDVARGEGPAEAERIGPFVWTATQQLWLCVPGIARFQVTGGSDILVDRDPAADLEGVRTFLLGTALGVLLMQRGNLMLHGNAVRVGDGCVICVGPSGAGKSTLAAGFRRRGYALLADDLVMVDDRCEVSPGVPRIKLWADAAHAMAIDTVPLRRVRANLEKFSYPVQDGFAQGVVPARAIYSLDTSNAATLSIQRLSGFAKFREVRTNTYRPQFVEAMALRERYLALCSRLASTVPVARVSRPVRDFTVDRLIDGLLKDLGESI